MKKNNLGKLKELISSISDCPIWQIKKGHGSFVTLDFGDQVRKTKSDGSEYLSGEYHLWIYTCHWNLLKQGQKYLNSNTIDSVNCLKLQDLKGEHLESIQLKQKENEILISFSNGLVFELSFDEKADSEDDYFILYNKNISTISYSPKEGIYIEEQLII